LIDPRLNGTEPGRPAYLDAETIFRDPEMVERLRDLALGFKGKAGILPGEVTKLIHDFGQVDWKWHLQVCECGHRNVAHSKGDPSREGQRPCLDRGCECEDYSMDCFAEFNIQHDAWLQRHYGRYVRREAA
jgi:hypothetical protein